MISVIYVGFWLAFATALLRGIPRAATALLVAIGAWLVATLFASLLASIAAGFSRRPAPTRRPDQVVANAS